VQGNGEAMRGAFVDAGGAGEVTYTDGLNMGDGLHDATGVAH